MDLREELARAICCPLGVCYMEQRHGTASECRACDWQMEAAAVEAIMAKTAEPISYALRCIANEDWTTMTAEDARREARAALATGEG